MRHLVVDLETLSNDIRHGVILSIGAMSFAMDEEIVAPADDMYQRCIDNYRYFYTTVKRMSQVVKYRFAIDPETLEWWMATDEKKALLHELLANPHALDIHEALLLFKQWIEHNQAVDANEEVELWSHGVTYDCMHLSEKWPVVFPGTSFNDVVPFRKMRDTRTLFAAYKAKMGAAVEYAPTVRKHHALEDAYLTAKSIQTAWYELT